MKVRVRPLHGRDFEVELDSFEIGLSAFRELVQENTGIVPARQRLIYQGRALTDDNRTLASYGIQDGLVIHCVERAEDSLASTERARRRAAPRDPQSPPEVEHGDDNTIGTTLDVERSGIFASPENLERLVMRAIETVFPNISQRQGITVNYDPNALLSIRLPAHNNPNVESPSAERLAMIYEHSAHIRAFFTIVERDDGLAPLVDQILSGVDPLEDEDEQRRHSEALVGWAREIERMGARDAAVTSESSSAMEVDGGNTEDSSRYHQNDDSQGHRYRMRHGLATDLTSILSDLMIFHERLRPHLERYTRVLETPVNFDIDDNERLLADSRANAFTMYLELLQRVLHRLSHVTHIVSDLNIHVNDAHPRRLYPQYQVYAIEPQTEGELVLRLRSPPSTGSQQTHTTVPADQLITLPMEGRSRRGGSISFRSGDAGHPIMFQRGNQMRSGIMVPLGVQVSTTSVSIPRSAPSVPSTNSQSSVLERRRTLQNAIGPVLSGTNGGNLVDVLLQNIRELGYIGERSDNPYQDLVGNLIHLAVDRSLPVQQQISELQAREQLANIPNLTQNLLEAVNDIFVNPTVEHVAVSQQLRSQNQAQRNETQAPQPQIRVATPHPGAAQGGLNISNILSSVLGNLGNLGSLAGGQMNVVVNRSQGNTSAPRGHHHHHHIHINRGQQHRVVPHIHVHAPGHVHSHGRFHSHSHSPGRRLSNVPPSTHPGSAAPSRITPGVTHQQPQNRPQIQAIPGHFHMNGDNLAQLLQEANIPGLPAGLGLGSGADENSEQDPFLPCSSRHSQTRRSHVHFSRLMDQVPEQESSTAPISSDPQLARDSAELQIDRNSSDDIVFLDSESDSERFVQFLTLALRSVRGLMDEHDRENNRPVTQAHLIAGVTVQERPHATIEITAEEVQLPPRDQNGQSRERTRVLSSNAQGITPTPPPRNLDLNAVPEASANVLRQLFQLTTNSINAPVGNLLSGIDSERTTNPNSLIGVIDSVVQEMFGVMDLMQLLNGRMDPLRNHRVAIRRYIVTNQLNDNSNPTREDLQSASRRISYPYSDLSHFFESEGGMIYHTFEGTRYDLVATANRIEQAAIFDLLSALFDSSVSDEQFANRVREITIIFCRRMMVVGNMSLQDLSNHYAYERFLLPLLYRDGESLLGADNASTIEWMRSIALEQLRNIVQTGGGPLRPNDILNYLVPVNDFGSAPKKMKHTHDHHEQQGSSVELLEDQPVTSSSESESSSSNSSESVHFEGPMRRATENEGDEEWVTHVPQSWVDTISADIQRMSTMPLYHSARSDMYQICTGRERNHHQIPNNPNPNSVANAAVQNAVSEAFEAAGERVPENLRSDLSPDQLSEMREHIDHLIMRRLQNDPDFEPSRFPNLQKFMDKKK